MKNLFTLLVLIILCFSNCSTSSDQKKEKTTSPTVETLKVKNWEEFWKDFQNAIEKNDIGNLTSMITFPLPEGGTWSGGNKEGLQKATFIKNYQNIFSTEVKDKIKNATSSKWSNITIVDEQQAKMMNAPVGASIKALNLLFIYDEGTNEQTESSQILNFTKIGDNFKLCSILIAG